MAVVGSVDVPVGDRPVRVYRRRWLVLIVFSMFSASNAFQWIQYSVIANKTAAYYDVGRNAINMLAMLYCIVYAVGILPVNEFINRFGLFFTIIVGSVLNSLGGWVKVLSAGAPFWVVVVAQTLASFGQLFVLGVPPILAAVWFGVDELATATSIGVFGNQIGCALSFVLPPLFVQADNVTKGSEVVETQLRSLALFTAAVCTALLLAALTVFRARPPSPPSLAQATATQAPVRDSYVNTIKYLFQHRGFVLLFITYGINAGTFYAYSTLLNAIVLYYPAYKGMDTIIGYVGLTFVVSGIFGALTVGPIIDRTHKYKLCTIVFYLFAFVFMSVGIGCLLSGSIWTVFVSNALLGFFLTGYLSLGFEFCVEITYPISENMTAGLLNFSAQIYGIALTFGGQPLIDRASLGGANSCVALLAFGLLVGAGLSCEFALFILCHLLRLNFQ